MIFEDIIPKSFQDDIEHTIGAPGFPWFYGAATNYSVASESGFVPLDNVIDLNSQECPQFTHVMRLQGKNTSEFDKLVYPLVYFMEPHIGKPVEVVRIKANLLYTNPNFPDNCYNPPHTDEIKPNFKSVVYYINDSDGDTILFNEKFNGSRITDVSVASRSSPKKGNFFVFDSTQFHASTPPRITTRRMVINFILRYA
jgi:hypothetical protein